MGSTNSNLPKVSSIKAIDIYFGICLLYVFGALVEFALVCYFNKPRYTTVKQDSLGFRGPGGKIQSLQNAAMVRKLPFLKTRKKKMPLFLLWTSQERLYQMLVNANGVSNEKREKEQKSADVGRKCN